MIRVLCTTKEQAKVFMDNNKYMLHEWVYASSLKEVLSLTGSTIIAIEGWPRGCKLQRMGQMAKLKMFGLTTDNRVIYAKYDERLV